MINMASFIDVFLWSSIPLLLALKLYNKIKTRPCTSTKRMDGKTVIVTGSNTGIGKETARDLARRGAKVIMACRDLKKAKEACDDIVASTRNTNVHVHHLDLSSFDSVRAFAKNIIETEPRLDVLINNAGVGETKKYITSDNLELGIQVNHLGPFLLTCLLLDLLKKSAPSRIVMVSSWMHKLAIIDFNNFNAEKWYSWWQQYSFSKLANVLTAVELSRKLEGTGVTANSLHPGTILTDVWRHVPPGIHAIVIFIMKVFCKDTVEGAQTTIHVAVSEEVENISGKYFSECQIDTPRKAAFDEGLAKKLWEKSEILVGLKAEERHF